ncbi:hypothetical protein MGSAQ_001333 [marine sediment metagenome]|uniref:Uncharacterized protein n=1 Tax=marine sediment metagenome TaxID=412755 RepID=A0A1B6NUP3_9ZZZZ
MICDILAVFDKVPAKILFGNHFIRVHAMNSTTKLL